MTFVLTRTPYRISFFGGGSDYPDWYLKHGGAVLSSTMNKYCYISARHLPKVTGVVAHRIMWRHVETVETVHDILHPAVREGLKFLEFDDSVGIEITYQGDLPARAGVGSSSTFAVGLLNALRTMRGEKPTVHDLATEAIHLERNILHDNVGSQDQLAAAYGGLNYIEFRQDGKLEVQKIQLPKQYFENLNGHLLLFFTGRQRTASKIAESVIRNIDKRGDQIRRLMEMAKEGFDMLTSNDIEAFGHLLDESWTLKRQISDQVSNEFVDRIYQLARDNGAWGGKLLGAGQSGFMCFVAPPDRHPQIVNSLTDIGSFVSFRLDTHGTEVVYSSDDRWGQP